MNLVVEGREREEVIARAAQLPSIKITMRNMCDLELIATGGFSPLDTFMGKADYDRVLKEMRLADGTLFPLPITLTADPKELPTVGEELALRSANFDLIAVMTLNEVYQRVKGTGLSLAELARDETDYKALIAKSQDVTEKLAWAQKLATRRLACGVVPELDDCFAALELT